jgi:type VI secretion system protein ImpA
MNDLAFAPVPVFSEATTNLLYPIDKLSPAGEDLSYSTLFDEIREARRSDDSGLTQREWATDIKFADWNLVCSLCENALKARTKDMQIAAWYIEANVYLQGFSGLAQGLELLHGLMASYWTSCYPVFDGYDLDERCAKIEWLNGQLPFALQKIPVTQTQDGVYTYLQWKESRWVENLGLKDTKARMDAIADGKLSGELFDKAVRQSGMTFYEALLRDSQKALAALDALNTLVEEKFGNDSPSLNDLRSTLVDCVSLAGRLYADVGGRATSESQSHTENTAHQSEVALNSHEGSRTITVGAVTSRQDAVQSLRNVAQYFRINEPHSPVALLADRAAKWAEMSLEQWLGTVIKDDGTLGQLRELLDVKAES